MDTAKIIIQQLGGFGKLKAMVGANTFIKDGENNIQFRFKGSSKANYVSVTLNDKDLYDMAFCKVGRINVKNKKHFNDIYNDKLVEIFENHTGLYLTF